MHLVSAIVGQPQAQFSFNNYFPAVSYNIFYKLRITLPSICIYVSQIPRISTMRPFLFSIYFYDKPNVRVKTSRAASKTNCVNFQQKGRNNMRKKEERNGQRRAARRKGRKKSEIQREKGVNERKDGREGDGRGECGRKKSGQRRQRHSTKCHFHRVGHRSSDAQRVR